MGLDLYFTKKRHAITKHNKKVEIESIELAYFRKVNFLIPFFKKKFGKDIENCKNYPITKEMVENLLHNCKKVIECHSKASELLPTTSGFFFGSTEYDEYYFSDIKDVISKMEEDVLPEFDNGAEEDIETTINFSIWY